MLRPKSAPTEARVGLFRSAAAVAAAELRLARRVVRTWVFAALAIGVGLAVYHVWAVQHSWLGQIAHPRFALPGLGLLTLWVLLAGIVLLAFDIPSRDERERVSEALDSRPFANVALLGGRLVAVALAAWLPLAVLAVALQAGGMVVEHLDARAGVGVEPVSLATFMFIDAPAALLFWGALVIFLAAAVRNRLIVAVAALGLLAIHFWAILNTPLYLLGIVSGVANLGLPGSDILPRTVSGADLVQRASVLVLAGGLLVTASSILPRQDSSLRTPGLGWGAALLAVGACGIGGLTWFTVGERAQRLAWAETHEAALGLPQADVERLTGTVSIDPGRELAIDAHLQLRASGTALEALRFSLNPGMAIQSVRFQDADVPYSHELGLLTVTPPATLRPGERASVSVQARGIPDPRFGYLDSAAWALDETLLGMPIALQGDQASIFDPDYVALTPAVAWLPMSSPNYAIDDPSRRAPDYHDIDLSVRVPNGWRVAGPGRAEENGGWRFKPSVPLAQFALIAGRFERRALALGGVEYELLIHPRHQPSLDYFSEGDRAELASEFLEQQIPRTLGAWLPYPHGVWSVVEVPGQLRRYGGGRIMDTVQALPAVQMLPEHGFPTRRYSAEPTLAGDDLGTARFHLFNAVASGPFGIAAVAGAARNMGPHLMSASGEGAVAANYLLESLTAAHLVQGRSRTVAPAHWLQIGQSPGLSLPFRVLNRLMGTATFSFGWYEFFGMNLENRSNEFSFIGVDAMSSTEGVDILIHKGNLLALAINSVLGRNRIAEFLTTMRKRHGGRTFSLDDFIAGLAEVDPAMASTIEHCMREDSFPGFLVSDARVIRLPDDENGVPRYQSTIHVRNDEPVPGVAGFGMRGPSSQMWGPFVHVPARTTLEFGIVSQTMPSEVRVETYLSQNARVMRLPAPRVDPELIVAEEPLIGVRPSDWMPPDLGIVVDDLDAGFSYVSPPEKGFRFGTASEDEEIMPEYYWGARVPGWHRQGDPLTMSWGKYRRTLTRILAGVGDGSATFAAELPDGGVWRLYYHLPGASASEGHAWRAGGWNPGDDFGTYNLEIVAGDLRIPVAYDARMAVPGWNDIGTFELPAGGVSVTVSDATDGQVIVADAVRWQLLNDPNR